MASVKQTARKVNDFVEDTSDILSIAKANGFATKSVIIIGLFGVVVLTALGSAIYFYIQYQKTQTLLKNPNTVAIQESKSLIEEVGKHIVLPQNEAPTIATVSDINKLKQQAFFSQAKNGDKVLIYTKAQKAILYDPVQKKIIEVGPINLVQPSSSPKISPTPATLRVALYNGTTTIGLTSVIEKDLKQKFPTAIVIAKENAKKTTYTKTIVVDLTGKQSVGVSQLAQLLKGEVGKLPLGESKPTDADILIILGK